MSTGRTIAAATVLSLVAALISWTTLGIRRPESAAAPTVEEVPASEVSHLDWPDGLNHYMVTLDQDALQAAAGSAPAGEEETLRLNLEDAVTGASLAPEDIRTLDGDLADALIESGLGSVSALPDGVTGGDVVAYFESVPGVQSVEYLAGSMVSVATSMTLEEVAAIPGVVDLLLPTTDWEPADTRLAHRVASRLGRSEHSAAADPPARPPAPRWETGAIVTASPPPRRSEGVAAVT